METRALCIIARALNHLVRNIVPMVVTLHLLGLMIIAVKDLMSNIDLSIYNDKSLLFYYVVFLMESKVNHTDCWYDLK